VTNALIGTTTVILTKGTADDFDMLIGWVMHGVPIYPHVSSFLLTIHVEIGGSEQIDCGGHRISQTKM